MHNKNSSQKTDLRYLWPYVRIFLRPILLTLMLVVFSRLAATIQPYYLKRIIDYISVNVGEAFAGNAELFYLLGLYFGFAVLSFTFEFLRDYVFAPVEMGIGRKVSQSVFDHLLKLPIRYHQDRRTGALARQLSRGAQSIFFLLDFLIISILPTVFELIFVTGFLLYLYEPKYGLITFTTIVFYALFTVYTTEIRQKYRLAANKTEDSSAAVEIETIANIDTVKYFGNEPLQKKKFFNILTEWYGLSVKSNRLFAAIAAGQSFILLIGFGLIVYLAVRESLAGLLTIGDLVLLTSYIVRLAAPVSTLGFVYRRIKDGITDLRAISEILAEPMPPSGPKKPAKPGDGSLEFKNVSFSYNERPVLRDISLQVPAGSRIAIVGPSGAGKSTITKLLFRLYQPGRGEISVDGSNIKEIGSKELYGKLALVPQDASLFNETIAENIRFGKTGATQGELNRAIRLSHLTDVVKRLPQGLNTLVGERGVKLSGGEKQRVAIARAIIRNPEILVFDEATSNLDAESEREILKAIDEVSKGRTTISIAHRLPTIINSDKIYVLDRGRIVESGTHRELLKIDGTYARLWRNFLK